MSGEHGAVDALLDRAIAAMNRGDVDEARGLADQVLASDATNPEAAELLTTEVRPDGEIRRLTVMFADLVGSTQLSEQLEAEAYRTIVARYQRICRTIIEDRYGGWIVALKGDGILAAFGFPVPHENDVERAVRAGLEITEGMEHLVASVAAEHGATVGVRVAVHKGIVFLDLDERDLYGFAVNVAARLEGLADVGTLLISEEVRRLLGDRFEVRSHEPRSVKGVATPLVTHTVLGARLDDEQPPHPADLFIGRSAELALLRAAWVEAVAGTRSPGSSIAVVGESGIGKSRLVEALANEVGATGATIVVLAGSSFHTEHGLWPIRRLLERRSGFTRQADGPERLRLLGKELESIDLPADHLPLLAALVGLGPQAGYEPVEADGRRLHERIAESAGAYLDACLGAGGALLIVDDAQWHDQETRDLVTRVVNGSRSDVLVAFTSRDPAAAPRGSRTLTVALTPLGLADRFDLLRGLGGGVLPSSVQDDIAHRSDGVPLYLEELVRAAISDEDDDAPAPGVGLPEATTVPEVLYEPLLSRLYVTPGGAVLAGAAAAIGREADRELLLSVSQLAPEEVDDALTALLGALILERAGPRRERYRFRHELLRAVAYDIQPPTRRRDLHGRVADALVSGAADEDNVDWAQVGEHYLAADRAGDAADAFERASASARLRGALAEARDLLSRAVEAAAADSGAASGRREAQLRLRRGYLALSIEGNSSAEAAADYERCLELSMGDVTGDELFATLVALCSYYCSKGELERATEVVDVLSSSVGDRSASVTGMVHGLLALIAWYRGRFEESKRWVDLAHDALQAEVDGGSYEPFWFIPLDPRAVNLSAVGLAEYVLGDVDAGLAHVDDTRGRCADLPFPSGSFTLACCLAYKAWAHLDLDQPDEAEALIDESGGIAERYGFDSWTIVAMTQREVVGGLRALTEPDPVKRREELSRRATAIDGAITLWKLVDQWVFVPYYVTLQGRFHREAGEVSLAIAALEDATAIAERTGMRFYEAETMRQLALCHVDEASRVEGLRLAAQAAVTQGYALPRLRAALDLHALTGETDGLESAVARFPGGASFADLDRARSLVGPG